MPVPDNLKMVGGGRLGRRAPLSRPEAAMLDRVSQFAGRHAEAVGDAGLAFAMDDGHARGPASSPAPAWAARRPPTTATARCMRKAPNA
jgi:hypothetical protein